MEHAENGSHHREATKSEDTAANEPHTLDESARNIGLHRVFAYIPTKEHETAEQARKRAQRERMRRQREEEKSQGYCQVNLPKVPVHLAEQVKAAVDDVLKGKPSATDKQPQQPYLRGDAMHQEMAIIVGAAILGAVIGFCAALLL